MKSKFFKLVTSAVLIAFGALSIQEFYGLAPVSGLWLGKFSAKWGTGFAIFITVNLVLASILLVLIWDPDRLSKLKNPLISWRQRMGRFNYIVAAIVVFLPVGLFIYTFIGYYFTGAYMRISLLLITSAIFAASITAGEKRLIEPANFYLGALVISSVFIIGVNLSNVTDYPFSLSWSEGNRFYDYSSVFGSGRYLHEGRILIPYKSTGRYMLWGLLFLLPDTPIWLHRLWDSILWTVPYILFGYLLSRWNAFEARRRLIFVLWVFLFLTQGPIYTPLVLSAILVVLLVRPGNILMSLLGVVSASYYAAVSRWTWFPSAPTWTAIILISHVEFIKGENPLKVIRRLLPIMVLFVIGLAAATLAKPDLFVPQGLSEDLTFSQSLLWFRLLPNATFSQGILLGILTATIPVIFLLASAAILHIWKPNWLQIIAYSGSVAAFMALGLVVSVKIGGGSNLHNLDMYFVTLAILTAIFLKDIHQFHFKKWPAWLQGLLALVLFLPSMNAVKIGSPLVLPSSALVEESLQTLRSEVSEAKEVGEVLFADQRQLLTFGFVEDVPLVMEYEKKYLMDMAMADNLSYFRGFYEDLANKRFSLIVINPLHRVKQDDLQGFAAENNAWVKWVARPVLCYYKPLVTFAEVRVQLLVPRADPHRCPDYIFE